MKNRLKTIRKECGYTQEQAAKISGIPLGTLRNWEQGIHSPSGEDLVILSDLYKVSTDTLAGSAFSAEGEVEILTHDEKQLVDCFRDLNNASQAKMLDFIKMVSTHPDCKR